MKPSIYLSSEKIYVLEYAHGSVQTLITAQLPEGCIISGKITDPAQLVECLSDLKDAHPSLLHSAVLVVDGGSVLVKRIEVPKLGKQQYDQLIRHDFAHSANNIDDLVCGYQVLKEDSNIPAILACAADISLVESYLEAFRAAGIGLDAMHIGIQAIMHEVARRSELRGKSFILNVVDGFTLLSMVFDHGKNMLIQRTRLYGEDDLQLASNMHENLSRLLQFSKSEHLSDITDSYYLGISDAALALLNAQNTFDSIGIHKLDLGATISGGGALPDDAHFVYLNTRLPESSIDLLQGRKERLKRQKQVRPKSRWIPVLALFTLVLAAPALLFFLLGRRLQGEIREVEAYLFSPTVAAKAEMLRGLERETSEIAKILRQKNVLEETQNALAPISDELLSLVITTHSGLVDIISFDYTAAQGILYLSATCIGESAAARYVDQLRRSDLIAEIDYTGYSYRSTGEYDFSIAVTLHTEQEVAQ